MRKADFFIPIFIIFSFIMLWSQGSQEPLDTEFTALRAESIRKNLMPLFEEDKYRELTSDEEIFLKHYSADDFPGTARIGMFYSRDKKLAAYLFKPDTPAVKGTVYLLHGYLDHTLSNRYLIRFLLEQGYAVLGFDLPGHGLSEGEPAAIDDFREYSTALVRFFNHSMRLSNEKLPGPRIALAHSTGCSVIMETVSLYGNIFDRIIMVSPLVHSVGWRYTPLGISLAEPFTDSVFRRFGGSSSNKEHEDFVEHGDPLQSRTVPFSWIYAHADWFDRMELLPVNEDLSLSIIQGEEDSVVDFKFNIPFLLEKYPAAVIYKIPEGEHSLLNEIPEIRESVFTQILEIIENPLN
ncbi:MULTISPECIES: alpha/beta hydrolase [unclassified Oceanispirochaeta]|uniref:alpha/beta hydrolase n=1 Tax=unclassified Oceanispirochaeta TaxID=2635722 RepID=UPI000E08D058|nr:MULTISPECIES: alpha/beta fold hydrolase [unclassified Oceanispirochaeta]MBF9015920.1 alpha/beta hydrolase [Oceanispirochaeta sp. M2]NPD72383.1 alpha/beta hydrolase [Oceanispirochaeta sp. M1]RDG32154.1 alpha/beta fold hydrolase [Oceanispirochaeta sp. M1]